MSKLLLTLFGGFRAQLESGYRIPLATKKGQALLAYLAASLGAPQPRNKVAALLWPDLNDAEARHNLRQTLFVLRRLLADSHIARTLVEGEMLFLERSVVAVDVITFERLVADGTAGALEQAAALYHGDLLEGLTVDAAPFDEWLMGKRRRLRERAVDALGKLLTHLTRAGNVDGAVDVAVRLLALDPLAEPAHRALMRLFVQQGRRAAALRQYQICVETLQRELDVEPEEETKELYRRVLPEHAAHARPRTVPAARPARQPREGLRALPASAPIIGRAAQLEELRQALDGARRGHGQVVVLLGEAGIGKTRLVEELLTLAGRRAVRLLVGHAYASERALAYGPWVDALRTALRMDPRSVDGLGSVWHAELSRVLPELAPGEVQPAEDAGDHRRLFEAIARWVEHLASRTPLVLVLEDLHWADEMSLHLLSFVGRRVHGSPVLLIGTARNDEMVIGAGLADIVEELRRDTGLVLLHLPPLSRDDTAALVRTLAGSAATRWDPAPFEPQIWRMSEGNPFVIVQSVKALQESGPSIASGALALPEKVRDLIARRLERLSAPSHELAAVAAVIGRAFDFDLLARAAGFGPRQTAMGLEELVRKRVLQGVGEQFEFVHDRIREVAYGEPLPVRRKLLHGQVARAIEALHADDLEPRVKTLAFHYWEAEEWGSAATHLRRAGMQAFRQSAFREAAGYYERAIAAMSHGPRARWTQEALIDLRLDLRGALFNLSEWSRALEVLLEAERLAVSIGDLRRLGGVASSLSNAFRMLGNYGEALEAGRDALALARDLGDVMLDVEAHYNLGLVSTNQGDYQAARELLAHAVGVLAQNRGDTGTPDGFRRAQLLIASRWWLVFVTCELGDFDDAVPHAQRSLREVEATRTPDSVSLMLAHLTHGHLYLLRGELPEAIHALEHARAASLQCDCTYFGPITARLANAHAFSGNVDRVRPLLGEGMQHASAVGRWAGMARFFVSLGHSSLVVGEREQARHLGEQALASARKFRDVGWEAWAHWLFGVIGDGDEMSAVEDVAAHYQAALDIARPRRMRVLVAHCHLGLGRLYRRAGDGGKAAEYLRMARTAYAGMGMTFWEQRAADAAGR